MVENCQKFDECIRLFVWIDWNTFIVSKSVAWVDIFACWTYWSFFQFRSNTGCWSSSKVNINVWFKVKHMSHESFHMSHFTWVISHESFHVSHFTWVISHDSFHMRRSQFETIDWNVDWDYFVLKDRPRPISTDRLLFIWLKFLMIYFSDEAFDTYKFFQIALASILLVTLPIMIGCLKFLLWISLNKCCNKQPKKVSALIYARRKLNPKNRNLVSEWNGCQSLLQILHLHLLKPMPQDEIPYFKDQYFILLKKWHTQNIQNLMIFSVFSAEQTLADEDTKSADTGCLVLVQTTDSFFL